MATRHSIPPGSSPTPTPFEPPTIREALAVSPTVYDNPLRVAWRLVADEPALGSTLAMAVGCLCQEVAALKGVTLPDRDGDE